MSQNVGCLGIILKLLGFRTGPAPLPPPQASINRSFISDAEAEFFHTLRHVVADKGLVFAQVSLRQLFYFPGGRDTPGRSSWFAKMGSRSVDFLIVHPKTLVPLVAVELDDSTHESKRRQQRDDEVEQVFAAAGLQLVRIRLSQSSSTTKISQAVLPALAAALR
jgi:Protein of unknown function (DUF2726)